MTSAWFANLAQQADEAADFLRTHNPSAAQRMVDAAATARHLARLLHRQENLHRLSTELADIGARLDRRTIRPSV